MCTSTTDSQHYSIYTPFFLFPVRWLVHSFMLILRSLFPLPLFSFLFLFVYFQFCSNAYWYLLIVDLLLLLNSFMKYERWKVVTALTLRAQTQTRIRIHWTCGVSEWVYALSEEGTAINNNLAHIRPEWRAKTHKVSKNEWKEEQHTRRRYEQIESTCMEICVYCYTSYVVRWFFIYDTYTHTHAHRTRWRSSPSPFA